MANNKSFSDDIQSGRDAVPVTVATADRDRCRAVWIGTSQSLDFCFDGVTWVTFAGITAGTILPFQAIGVRKSSDLSAPATNDVVFLY